MVPFLSSFSLPSLGSVLLVTSSLILSISNAYVLNIPLLGIANILELTHTIMLFRHFHYLNRNSIPLSLSAHGINSWISPDFREALPALCFAVFLVNYETLKTSLDLYLTFALIVVGSLVAISYRWTNLRPP